MSAAVPGAAAEPRFGRLLTAMVTPFDESGGLDETSAADLARHLVDDRAHDGLVVNGTTGESPTTTDAEKARLVQVVVEAVGDRASVVAGVGSYDTAHTVRLARQATEAGADGLLVVTPFYSRPPQQGVLAHFETVAEAAALPMMLYDIPARTGTAIATETLLRLAEHERIVAVKDAKGDLVASSEVIGRTGLDFYAGDDAITLPLLAVGGVGVVGTSTHFTGLAMRALIEAYLAGDHGRALALHQQHLPVFTGVFAAPGCAMVKATLTRQGRRVGELRLPMVCPTPAAVDHFLAQLERVGLR